MDLELLTKILWIIVLVIYGGGCVCFAVLWIVMPGGAEPGVKSKLMWGNLFPWIKDD